MLNRLIDLSLDRPWLVAAGLVVLIALGLRALQEIPIDAFPDLTNNQVTVVTDAPGMATVEVEQLVTFPLESAMMGLPSTLDVRSISKLGLSMITVVFEDDVDPFLARQLVNERLNAARDRIPQGLQPQLGPLATPFGEVFQYTVEGEGYSAMELKTLHDWEIKYQLRAVPGVADVNTWGGFTRQYEIVVDPQELRAYDLRLGQVLERIRENNENFSGGFVEHASEQFTVRGLGRAVTPEDLGSIVVDSREGIPIYLRQIADVTISGAPRQGAVTTGGDRETLSGMVIMLKGQNSKTVIERIKVAIAGIEESLPEGVEIKPFYDQSTVIDGSIRTVRNNLLEGGALVVVVLFASLGQFRAALLVALVLPLSMLSAFVGMRFFDVTANLMSLGAVDLGVVIDGAVVMVDNCVRRISDARGRPSFNMLETVREATHEMATPVLSGVVIVLAVYIPILSLEGLEGRMFRPMATTVCAAVFAGLVLALFALPTGCRLLLRPESKPRADRVFGPLHRVYRRALVTVIDHRVAAVSLAALLVTGTTGSLSFIGAEFMPRLDEGSIVIQTLRLPSISLTESIDLQLEVEQVVEEFPEVTSVVSKLGRPDFATEAMGIYEADLYVGLQPRSEWTTASTKEELVERLSEALETVPGIVSNFTQPMAMRLDETVSGVRADVAVKVFGDDEEVLERVADDVLQWLAQTRGAADAQREVFSGAAEWQVDIRRDDIARYGLNVADVRELIESAINGILVTEVIEGRRRFRVVARLPERYRMNRDTLGDLFLHAPRGELVPLRDVATIRQVRGPEVVRRENSQRRIVVQSNIRGRDLAGFVADAQRLIEDNVEIPPGYFLRWGGQFEQRERAMQRLSILTPVILTGIFFILYLTFGSARQALLMLLLVPFATVGGTAALWLRGMNLNVSASIGFIAVFGVAILDGLVLVSTINRMLAQGRPLRQALLDAGALRLRPVIMTSVVAALGFLPMALATSTGAEMQRPLATVVIGGLVSSTLLTLLLVPTLFPWFSGRGGEIRLRPGVAGITEHD